MSPRVLIGGVGYRWQRDASFGLVVSDVAAALTWPAGVDVQDLGYGAIYVAQDLLHAEPRYDRLIIVAGVARGRTPGRLYRTQWQPAPRTPAEIQARIGEAGGGVIDVDHLLVIAQHFEALPAGVLLLELEPVVTAGGLELSAEAAAACNEAIAVLRDEVGAPQVAAAASTPPAAVPPVAVRPSPAHGAEP
jgi:hydrogenase maturation protease